VSGVVVDSSAWIDFLSGRPTRLLEEALHQGSVVLPPLVVAELIAGATREQDRAGMASLLEELPLHATPRDHWIRVGDLRRSLRQKGVRVSTPDAHVAQCALDRDAVLLSRDKVFHQIAAVTPLRLRTE